MKSTEVVIAGAGPVGLTLACELALQGVSTVVLERRAHRSVESRALGIHARTLDLLAMRGMAGEFLKLGNSIDTVALRFTGGGSTVLDLAAIDSENNHMLILPQSETERILEERAGELGVQIIRQAAVAGVEELGRSVVCHAETPGGPQSWEAEWLVGCDGARSTIRQNTGTGFEGEPYPYSIMVADAQLRQRPANDLSIIIGRTGLVVCTAFGDGLYRVAVVEHGQPVSDSAEVPMEEISAGLARVTGTNYGPYDPVWTSRFTIEERRADTFRTGRVLLAGDAAHIHSPLGGQGLNLGVQDAFNLGWKLAAVQRGWASDALLDSYAEERGRRASNVIAATDKVTRLMMARPLPAQLLRGFIAPRVLGQSRVQRTAAEALSGVSTRYLAEGASRRSLVGRTLPNLLLRCATGERSRLYDHLHDGRHLVVAGPTVASRLSDGPRLKVLEAQVIEPGWFRAEPLLVRPDGHVSADRPRSVQRAATALAISGGPAVAAPPRMTDANSSGGQEGAGVVVSGEGAARSEVVA